MKCHAYLLAAACLLAGGSLVSVGADNPVVPADKAAQLERRAEFPAGITAKDLDAAKSIEKSLVNIAEDGLSKNGFDNLIGYLVDQDRRRLADKKNMKVDDLNAQTEKISNNLKAKYGKDFKFNKDALLNTLTILTGEVDNPDLLIGKWPVNATFMEKPGNAEGKVTPSDAAEAKKMFGGDVNLEKGRKVALVTIPRSHGRPAVTASMISEAAAWRLDIPNNIDGDKLHDQLLAGLTGLANQATWPDSYDDAQRLMTHVIIGSIYGVDMTPNFDNLKTAGEK